MINCIIICVAVTLICVYSVNKITSVYKNTRYNYKDKIELFDYFLSKSYDTVYETDLITTVINNTKLSNEERETIERNFVKRTMTYMGKNNLKIFKDFFGSNETMFVNMIRYMRKRINDDGLTKIINEQQSNI